MHIVRQTLLFLLTLLTPLACASDANNREEASLQSLIARFKQNTNDTQETILLTPAWIGTVTRSYLRDDKKAYGKDEPEHIRFSHAWIRGGRLRIARMPGNGYQGVYQSELAPLDAIVKCTTLEDLLKLLGPSHAFGICIPSAWWSYFSVTPAGEVRYLSVHALGSDNPEMAPVGITILEVREGKFRPAHPNSPEESQKFKTGQQLFDEEQGAKKARRDQYPRPLRDLLEAREAPGDHDLTHYKAYLNSVRAKPDKALFEQLLAHPADRTAPFDMMLDDILIDSSHDLTPWNPDQRRLALHATIDALPLTKSTADLESGVQSILRALGGGELNLHNPTNNHAIKFSVTVETNSYSTTWSQFDRDLELTQQLQAALRRQVQ